MVDEVKTFEFMWELIPLDANLLSLELPYDAEKLRTHQIRTVVKSLQVRDLPKIEIERKERQSVLRRMRLFLLSSWCFACFVFPDF